MDYIVNFEVDGITYRGPNPDSRLNAQPLFSCKGEQHRQQSCAICGDGWVLPRDPWHYRAQWKVDETIWLEEGYLEFSKESRSHD